MQSLSQPLNALHEDGSWFARAHELKLWVVRCDENLRKTVITLLPKFEFHHDNERAWPVVHDAHGRADDGWQLRANNLAKDWAQRVEAFASEGVEFEAVEASQASEPTKGLEAFATTLAAIDEAKGPPLAGLVVVLAPTTVEDAAALEHDLLTLLGDPRAANTRWILVLDLDLAPPARLLAALGDARAQVSVCAVDEDAQRKDFSIMLGGSPDRFGMAAPVGVTAPPRVDDPPPLPTEVRDAALQAKGINPALIEGGPQIRAQTLGAAIALQQGRGAEAIALQEGAVERCAALGLTELQVITQVGLAAYLSGLGHRARAKQVTSEAAALGQAHELHRPASQATLSLGLLHALDRDYEAAMGAYVESAQIAEAGDEPLLAIEGWRMAGQLAAQLSNDRAAVDAFGEALRIAKAGPPELLPESSAAEAARQLAGVYERNRMPAPAASLHELADALERGELPPEHASPSPDQHGGPDAGE